MREIFYSNYYTTFHEVKKNTIDKNENIGILRREIGTNK